MHVDLRSAVRPLLLWMVLPLLAAAQVTGSIQGTVIDPSHQPVAGASVAVTDLTTGAARHVSTDAQGRFAVSGLAPHNYQVTAARTGFNPTEQLLSVSGGAPAHPILSLHLASVSQSVMVRAGAVPGATRAPSQAEVFTVPQTLRVLDREQIDALSPAAGSAQIAGVAPGINVTGFGSTGATKSTITLNGVQQGWGGYGGFTTAGALGVTFDGIPVADAATGLWQSNMFPQGALVNNAAVTYGPGNPDQRWYTNVGGGVEFTPLQPTEHMHASLSQTYGSFRQENTDFEFATGSYGGWSAVLAGGHGSGNSFRQGIGDQFGNPSHDMDLYGKLIKQFGNGNLQFGVFSSDSEAYRPQVIPVTDQGITVDAQPGSATYSQQSSGFYSTLPFASYHKYDTNLLNLFWGKLNLSPDSTTTLSLQSWYERVNRLHNRTANVYSPGAQAFEWNNPYTKMLGQRAQIIQALPWNTITAGAWYLHTVYNSRNNFYNPADGGSSVGIANAGGKIRSSLFDQDMYAFFAQDQISLGPWLILTPGVRYFSNTVNYADRVRQDFAFAANVSTLPTHCFLNGTVSATSGDLKIQSADCAASAGGSGVEPTLSFAIRPNSWFNLYGGYSEALKAPQTGGGGGMFQSVDPASYRLARAEYTQGGVKVHFDAAGPLTRVLAGVAYFHLGYYDQELDIGLANGDSLAATASSAYHGVNAFFDANATSNLHLYLNTTFERAHYTNYVVNQNYDANGNLLSGAVSYNNLAVPYVPNTLVNIGGYYSLVASEALIIQPRLWYQYTGRQTVFDNVAGAPSSTAMPSFGTINLGLNVPYRWLNFRLTMLNLLNKQYNQYEYISSGGYFGTSNGGYLLAYPGAPRSVYGTVSMHF